MSPCNLQGTFQPFRVSAGNIRIGVDVYRYLPSGSSWRAGRARVCAVPAGHVPAVRGHDDVSQLCPGPHHAHTGQHRGVQVYL